MKILNRLTPRIVGFSIRNTWLRKICMIAGLTALGSASAAPLMLLEYGQAGAPRVAAAANNSTAGITPMRFSDLAFTLAPGDVARIALPNGSAYNVTFERAQTHATGERTWFGFLSDYGNDFRMVITAGNNGTFGSIKTPTGEYQFSPRNGVPSLTDVNAARLKRFSNSGQDALPALETARSPNLAAASAATVSYPPATADNPAMIDLLMLYSPGLVNKYGDGLTARLNQLVAVANQAYVDSKVFIKLRVVGMEKLDFTDNSSNVSTLGLLADGGARGTGIFSDVKALRLRYGADLVTFIRPFVDVQVSCGNGFMPSDPKNISGSAFSTVSEGEIPTGVYCPDTTLAHEIGHNLGLDHDYAAASGKPVEKYAHGNAVKDKFWTVMAYPQGGIEVLKFSSPNLTCAGVRCGAPNYNDNARTLNEVAHYAANGFETKIPNTIAKPATRLVGLADKCLNAHPSTTYLSLYDCVSNVWQQQWVVSGDRIKSANGSCVQTYNHSLANGTPIHLWPCQDSGTGNRWKINANNSIESLDVPGKCIDVQGAQTTNETPAIIWSCHGGANQRWVLQ